MWGPVVFLRECAIILKGIMGTQMNGRRGRNGDRRRQEVSQPSRCQESIIEVLVLLMHVACHDISCFTAPILSEYLLPSIVSLTNEISIFLECHYALQLHRSMPSYPSLWSMSLSSRGSILALHSMRSSVRSIRQVSNACRSPAIIPINHSQILAVRLSPLSASYQLFFSL